MAETAQVNNFKPLFLASPLALFHPVVQTLFVRITTDFLNMSATLGTKDAGDGYNCTVWRERQSLGFPLPLTLEFDFHLFSVLIKKLFNMSSPYLKMPSNF